jgi:hypothetical protein
LCFVPLVKGEQHRLLLPLLGLDQVAGGDDRPDLVVHGQRLGQERTEVIVELAGVDMEGEVLDVVVNVLQHGLVPVREGRHVRVRAAAGNQLQRRIDPFHGASCLAGQPPVRIGSHVPDLPGAIHLVAQAPRSYSMQLRNAV